MKLIILWVCIFLAIFVNQSGAQEVAEGPIITPPPNIPTPPSESTSTTYRSTTTKIPTPTTPIYRPTPPKETPCGSNNLGDYKGGCDQSVPVIVMPKGRPIMERVLDWFKCGTPSCL